MDSVKDGIALFFSFKINFVLFLSRVDTAARYGIRNNFLKIKNIILIKNTFKNNYFQTTNNTIKYIH